MNTLTIHPNGSASRMFSVVKHFAPNWFAVTMGTGIVAAVLAALPQMTALQFEFARLIWVVDAMLFLVFSLMFAGRLVLFPESFRPMLNHPIQSMFLGTIPMGLAAVINGLIVFESADHPTVISLAYHLWVVDAILSVVIAVLVPFLAFTEQSHALERVTGVLLLPLVAPEVAAATAALIAPHLPAELAGQTVVLGYVLWAVSVPLAFTVLTILFSRFLLHKLPPRELGVSSWLTLGPIGTGALGLLTLGQAAPSAFAGSQLQAMAQVARDFGVLGGLLLWGVGIWWLATAILFVLSYRNEGLPFNLGWWGFTFPLGVYIMATLTLGKVTGLHFFSAVGALLAFVLFGLWTVVATRTVSGMVCGQLFLPPN